MRLDKSGLGDAACGSTVELHKETKDRHQRQQHEKMERKDARKQDWAERCNEGLLRKVAAASAPRAYDKGGRVSQPCVKINAGGRERSSITMAKGAWSRPEHSLGLDSEAGDHSSMNFTAQEYDDEDRSDHQNLPNTDEVYHANEYVMNKMMRRQKIL